MQENDPAQSGNGDGLPEFFTAQEFADATKFSRVTIYRFCARGKIKCVPYSRHKRIPKSEYKRWQKGEF